MSKEKCVAEVWPAGGFRPFQCSKRGKVERNGKLYCGTHDPVRVAERDAIREAKWLAEKAMRDAKWAERAALEADARRFRWLLDGDGPMFRIESANSERWHNRAATNWREAFDIAMAEDAPDV